MRKLPYKWGWLYWFKKYRLDPYLEILGRPLKVKQEWITESSGEWWRV